MAFKQLCLLALVLGLLAGGSRRVEAASKKLLLARAALEEQQLDEDDEISVELEQEQEPKSQLAGLYVKDSNENGQLRFLGSGLTGTGSSSSSSSSNSINSALNQYITQKQDLLEQLRPTNNLGTLTGGTGTVTGTGTGTGTATSNGAIYVNVGGSSSSSSNSAVNSAIYGGSPIVDLLPQIIASGVTRGGNRRRNQNRRRVVNRRGNAQRRRRPSKNRPQVMIVRPNRG